MCDKPVIVVWRDHAREKTSEQGLRTRRDVSASAIDDCFNGSKAYDTDHYRAVKTTSGEQKQRLHASGDSESRARSAYANSSRMKPAAEDTSTIIEGAIVHKPRAVQEPSAEKRATFPQIKVQAHNIHSLHRKSHSVETIPLSIFPQGQSGRSLPGTAQTSICSSRTPHWSFPHSKPARCNRKQ